MNIETRLRTQWWHRHSADFRYLMDEYIRWAEKTFPEATPESCVEHLRREVEELQEEPRDALELADAFMLVVHAAYRANVDLFKAVNKKLTINQKRDWGLPDHMGVRSHIDPKEQQVELGPYDCRCKTMVEYVLGDGCDICQPRDFDEEE